MQQKEYSKIKSFIQSTDPEFVLLGMSLLFESSWFKTFREEHKDNPIEFLEYHTFGQVCDYIETEYIPHERKTISKTALKLLKESFLSFIEDNINI